MLLMLLGQFDNDRDKDRTIMTVQALNRENLLRDITNVLADMKINVVDAKILTEGERAMDVFQAIQIHSHESTNELIIYMSMLFSHIHTRLS